MSEEFVDEAIVEEQTGLIDRAPARRKNAGPAHRKAVGLQSHLGHQRHILFVAVVMIDRDVAIASLVSLAGTFVKRSQTLSPLPSAFHPPST